MNDKVENENVLCNFLIKNVKNNHNLLFLLRSLFSNPLPMPPS